MMNRSPSFLFKVPKEEFLSDGTLVGVSAELLEAAKQGARNRNKKEITIDQDGRRYKWVVRKRYRGPRRPRQEGGRDVCLKKDAQWCAVYMYYEKVK